MVKRGQPGDVRWWVHPREIASMCVCVYFEVCSKSFLPSLFSGSWGLGSGVNGGSMPDSALYIDTGGLWWGKLWHMSALVESSTLPSLNLTGTVSSGKTDPHQGNERAWFNHGVTGAVWVLHRFHRRYNVETGWPAAVLWLKGCKFSPNKSQNLFFSFFFFFCLWALQWIESNHPWKSPHHSAGALFLWKHFYVIAVTRFALSQQPPLHLLFPFYKHIHMWELTSRDVCLNLYSPGTRTGSAWSRNCGSRAAGPRCRRAGTRWTGGRAPNWPEWLQSEPIRDKRSPDRQR